MALLWWIIVGLVAGWTTSKIMAGKGYGALMNIVLGIAGAILGGFFMKVLGFSGKGDLISTILIAIVGAVILATAIQFFFKRAPGVS